MPDWPPGNDWQRFTRCEVEGCDWHVLRPATRCSEHGGPDAPEYWESPDGELLVTHHMDTLEATE